MTKITHSIAINGSADAVFEALSTEQGVKSWWTNFTKVDAFEGGRAEFHFPAYKVSKFAEVKKLTPGKQVTWLVTDHKAESPDWINTTIDFALSQSGDQTLVEFNHTGWPESSPIYDQCVAGWDYFLTSLKQLIETGAGTPETKETVAER